MAPLVDSAQIEHAELLRPLPFHYHAYVWPFVIVWPVFLRYYLTPDLYDAYIGAPEWTFVWCGTIITVQSLVWLSTHWSVGLDARFTASKAKNIQDAQLIKVIPIVNAGSAEISKLVRDKVSVVKCVDWTRADPGVPGLGWRQDESLLSLPETPIPVQSRPKVFQPAQVPPRRRAEAPHRPFPVKPRL